MRLDKKFASSVVQAEQFAKNKFNDYKSLAANYSSNMSDWFENHFLFEFEARMDYGLEAALGVQASGLKLAGKYSKSSKPIAQLGFGYKGGWYGESYDPVLNHNSYGYNGISDPIREELGLKVLFWGSENSYYPNNHLLFTFDHKLNSQSFSTWYGNYTEIFNYSQRKIETQYSVDFGSELALLFGFRWKLRIGYYK